MLGHQLASGLYYLAGSPQRQLHAGGLSRRIHPVHKTFARQNGRRGHRHVTFRPDALFQPDGQLFGRQGPFQYKRIGKLSLRAMGQSGTLAARPSITVACPQARKRFKFLNSG